MRSRVAEIIPDRDGVYSEIADALPEGLAGSELVLEGYAEYESRYDTSAARNRPMNGKVFECLILEALLQQGISPAYHQATVVNVPNVVFDILLYDPRRPVVLSCKTSLRERWKQADLEGTVLKQVYGGATSILLTLSEEGSGVQEKIDQHEVNGLDQCIVVSYSHSAFDSFLTQIADRRITRATPVLPVSGKLVQ